MAVIDVHTHFIPRFVVEEVASRGLMGLREEDGWLVHPEGYRYPADDDFLEPSAILAAMDERGIDVSVLSIAPPLFFYEHPLDETREFACRANDALAGIVEATDRLEGLATLPLQAGDVAAAELERAVSGLGLRGAQIGASSSGGRPLDRSGLEAVFEVASRLGAPLMLHPSYVGSKPGLEDYYLTNSIGNPLDTTVAAARLIHSGILERYPDLRLILVHAGGFLPYQLGRFDHAFAVRNEPRGAIDDPPSSFLGRFWLDTITHSDASLRFLAELVGCERLVLGTAIPFDMGDPRPLERLRRSGVDPHLLGATAAELLGLPGDGEAAATEAPASGADGPQA
ncbi:MAG: amidohydrolase family protein [Gaiellales bacterium]